MKEIRLLKAEEIECRVQSCGRYRDSENGWCILLLYKDARCDQRILDETFGMFGWQRRHEVVNGQLCCTVSIKNPDTGEWIEKQDVGTESNTEAVKGQFSDSYKRACFNWGLGRELYTAPTIVIKNLTKDELVEKGGKVQVSPRCVFTVSEIGYDDARNIDALTIVDGNGKVRYKIGQVQSEPKADQADGEEIGIDELFEAYAMPAIRQAQTKEELTRIWNDFPRLQSEGRFSEALNLRLKDIKEAA